MVVRGLQMGYLTLPGPPHWNKGGQLETEAVRNGNGREGGDLHLDEGVVVFSFVLIPYCDGKIEIRGRCFAGAKKKERASGQSDRKSGSYIGSLNGF